METLLEVFNRNECDKGTTARNAHGYHRAYEKDLNARKNDPINILEVGIYKGISAQCWLDFFPNAQVYGIDIFERFKPFDIEVLNDPRMHYINYDSTSPRIVEAIKHYWGEDIKFDFIIDDGLHTPNANRKTFLNLIDFLKEDGVYFIEDVFPLHKMTDEEWKHQWIQRLPNEYNEKTWKRFMGALSNYRVGIYDFRKQGKRKPDSVIYRVMRKNVE